MTIPKIEKTTQCEHIGNSHKLSVKPKLAKEYEQSLKVLTIPEVEMLEKISMKLEQQDRKIITIPDKPDKFPDIKQN